MAGIKQIGVKTPVKKRSVTHKAWAKDLWLEDTLDETLRGYMAPQRTGVFYPSALGNTCDRYLYLAYNGLLRGQPLNSNLKRIFDTGNALEERLEKYFTKMGVYIDREISVKQDYPPISGRIDFLIQHEFYGVLPIESKTINTAGYAKLRKPKEDHELQLQIYLNMGGYAMGTVLYENKNDQKIRTYLVEQSDEAWDKILTRCLAIMKMVTPPEKCTGNKWCGCKKLGLV